MPVELILACLRFKDAGQAESVLLTYDAGRGLVLVLDTSLSQAEHRHDGLHVRILPATRHGNFYGVRTRRKDESELNVRETLKRRGIEAGSMQESGASVWD